MDAFPAYISGTAHRVNIRLIVVRTGVLVASDSSVYSVQRQWGSAQGWAATVAGAAARVRRVSRRRMGTTIAPPAARQGAWPEDVLRALYSRGPPPEQAVTFTRITVNPDQMGGVPCIRGLRIPVATVVGMVADGMQSDEILRHLPDLELADVQEALRYAAEAVRERELPVAHGT